MIKKAILIVSIVIGIRLMDIKALLIGFLIVSCISYFINYFFSRRVVKVRNWDELKSVIKVIITIVSIAIPMYLLKSRFEFGYLQIIISLPLILLLYLSFLRIQGLKLNLKDFKNLSLLRSSNLDHEISD